jgi:phospholipid/cholesterol/gamma-HCH transport system permease protein
LFGGYLVGVVFLGVDPGSYVTGLEDAVEFSEDVLGSLIKAFVFGILVALIATYRGFTAAPSAAGVSAATTSTVVVASVTTLIVDYLITALWGV